MKNQPATRKDIDDVLNVLRGFIKQVDDRFDASDNRIDMLGFQTNERFDKLEARMEKLELAFDRLLNTVDKLIARIDHYETEQTARDSQFQKLLEWARKVSEKTGIPLENL